MEKIKKKIGFFCCFCLIKIIKKTPKEITLPIHNFKKPMNYNDLQDFKIDKKVFNEELFFCKLYLIPRFYKTCKFFIQFLIFKQKYFSLQLKMLDIERRLDAARKFKMGGARQRSNSGHKSLPER